MSIKIQTATSVAAWYGEWQHLWHAAQGDPFLHPAWHESFVAASNPTVAPVIVGTWRHRSLIGVLPLRRDADGVLRFLSASRSDYEDALCCGEHEREIIDTLAGYLLEQRFDLAQIPQGSRLAEALQAHGLRARPAAPCPGIRLSAAVVQDVTSRKSLRRHYKKLAQRGSISLELVNKSNFDDAFARFMHQHIARWLLAGEDSLFLNQVNERFYRRLLNHADFHEFGTFHVLKAGAFDAAYHVGLHGRSSFVWYKPTFDLNLISEGPGEVLLKSLVEYAHESGMAYFDFSRGNEAFKLRFANAHRQNQRITHRLPITQAFTGRLMHSVARAKRYWGTFVEKLFPPSSKTRAEELTRIAAPTSPPDVPIGHHFDLRNVDLVAFGSMRGLFPEYVTSERMNSAVERRRRGDSLLIIRRDGDAIPVYFAWLRVEAFTSTPGGDRDRIEHASRRVVIFDLWGPRGLHSLRLRRLAVQYLAWHAQADGLSAWIDREEAPGND